MGPQESTGTLTQNGQPKGGGSRNQLLSLGSSGSSPWAQHHLCLPGSQDQGPDTAQLDHRELRSHGPQGRVVPARSQSSSSLGDPCCPLV